MIGIMRGGKIMPIPSGSWTITAGTAGVGSLTFNAFSGAVSGQLLNLPFIGFFDETSQMLTMLSNPQTGSEGGFSDVLSAPLTIFKGSLFPPFTPTGSKTPVHVLAGVWYSNNGSSSPVYASWYAQNPQPVKTAKEHKDGGKDTKDHKDFDKTSLEKLAVEKVLETATSPVGISGGVAGGRAPEEQAAIGRSFIEAQERPSLLNSILKERQDTESS
jgi:hypothetical protein